MKISALDLGLDTRPEFRPYKISREHMPLLFKGVREEIKTHARTLIEQEWKIYTVDQDTGWCNAYKKLITIPIWCIDRKPMDHREWYIAHEFAHAYDMCRHSHGPEFMEWLKKICPEDVIHHELGYKPRNAQAAGISQKLIDLL